MVSELVEKILKTETEQKQREKDANVQAKEIIETAKNKADSIINNSYLKSQEFEKSAFENAEKIILDEKERISAQEKQKTDILNNSIEMNKENAKKAVIDLILDN